MTSLRSSSQRCGPAAGRRRRSRHAQAASQPSTCWASQVLEEKPADPVDLLETALLNKKAGHAPDDATAAVGPAAVRAAAMPGAHAACASSCLSCLAAADAASPPTLHCTCTHEHRAWLIRRARCKQPSCTGASACCCAAKAACLPQLHSSAFAGSSQQHVARPAHAPPFAAAHHASFMPCRTRDIPINPDTGEPVEVEPPNEVQHSLCCCSVLLCGGHMTRMQLPLKCCDETLHHAAGALASAYTTCLPARTHTRAHTFLHAVRLRGRAG